MIVRIGKGAVLVFFVVLGTSVTLMPRTSPLWWQVALVVLTVLSGGLLLRWGTAWLAAQWGLEPMAKANIQMVVGILVWLGIILVQGITHSWDVPATAIAWAAFARGLMAIPAQVWADRVQSHPTESA